MGAGTSTQQLASEGKTIEQDLFKKIDTVAAQYILTQNFNDMKNLAEKKYCDNLVVLTSEVIGKFLKSKNIEYLADDTDTEKTPEGMKKEDIVFLRNKYFNKLAGAVESDKKKNICIGIAKFYVRIAHIFSAIIFTLNPKFVTTDSRGMRTSYNLLTKNNMEKNKDGSEPEVKTIFDNICSNRLEVLKNKENYNVSEGDVTINPRFCNMNLPTKDRLTGEINKKTLGDEPGIPELEKLYYDDYDYKTGKFVGMTDKMRKDIYQKDVETFYKQFTGNSGIKKDTDGNPLINSFNQILLKDYSKLDGCKEPGRSLTRDSHEKEDKDDDSVIDYSHAIRGKYRYRYTSSIKDTLFKKYADNLKLMMTTISTNQKKLSEIIEKIFKYDNSNKDKDGNMTIVINPALTNAELDEIVKETREVIVQLYLNCEKNFEEGLNIFRSIVEKTIMDTQKTIVSQMEKDIYELEKDSEVSAPDDPSLEPQEEEQEISEDTSVGTSPEIVEPDSPGGQPYPEDIRHEGDIANEPYDPRIQVDIEEESSERREREEIERQEQEQQTREEEREKTQSSTKIVGEEGVGTPRGLQETPIPQEAQPSAPPAEPGLGITPAITPPAMTPPAMTQPAIRPREDY